MICLNVPFARCNSVGDAADNLGSSMKSREEYLQLAQDAEIYEKRSTDRTTRNAWEKIVVGYLELAEIADGKVWDGLGNARASYPSE